MNVEDLNVVEVIDDIIVLDLDEIEDISEAWSREKG